MEEHYADAGSTFMEVFSIVRFKMSKGLPMTAPKEEAMFEFIKSWTDTFGHRSL